MNATEHLGSQWTGRLFHGTVHPLQGDTLKPGVALGSDYRDINARRGQSKKDVVSASSDERKAWYMAIAQPGRARVHEVEPHPETRIGVENVDHPAYQSEHGSKTWSMSKPPDNAEFVAPSFKVKDTHWTMPPERGRQGRQGTLPHIDWAQHLSPKQFGMGNANWSANHHDPMEAAMRDEQDAHREHRQRVREGKHWKHTELPGQEALF